MTEGNRATECSTFDSTLVVKILEVQLRDIAVVQKVRSEIESNLKDGSIQNVVLDLSAVDFVGSVAFLAFLAIRRFPTVDKILLCNLREHVREVFVLCRLLNGAGNERSPFTEVASVADALKLLDE